MFLNALTQQLARLKSGRRLPLNAWTIGVLVLAALMISPVLVVLSSIFSDQSHLWEHLAVTVLPQYIANSVGLMLGVGAGVLLVGVGTAWLVTMCDFPGRRLFECALLLPLAAPAYLLAYAYTEVLDYYGPVQGMLRQVGGWESATEYWFPDVRSLGGAIAMLTLVLYPYVYLLARVTFLEQSTITLEASRTLGCGPWRSFFQVALPLARPAIITGLSLALMETLNDFGTVEYFGIPTFTTGIYRTWFGRGEREAAAQLAALLMLFILALILVERWSRRQAQYYQTSSRLQHLSTYPLQGGRALLAGLACALPTVLGLVVPAGLLLYMTMTEADRPFDARFVQLASHSFWLASLTAGVAVLLALFLAYGVRLQDNPMTRLGVRVAAMGYAIPGSVIAVGILIAMGGFDRGMATLLRPITGAPPGLLLSGTVTALMLAYLVRFLAISLGTVESSLGKIRPNFDHAARSLGHSTFSTLTHIHAPLMRGSLFTAVMLVFVDVMKELPATIVIRPANFDTLAVQVYQYASDERLIEAAAPALAIIVVGLLPVILLSWQIARSRVRSL